MAGKWVVAHRGRFGSERNCRLARGHTGHKIVLCEELIRRLGAKRRNPGVPEAQDEPPTARLASCDGGGPVR